MQAGLLVAVALACAGCSGALVSRIRYEEGHAPAVRSLDGAVQRAADKAAVLERLGPPVEILPQADGDIFVYRLSRTEMDVINVNASIFTGIVLPFYADVDGTQTDQVVYVFFDSKGRVRDVSMRRGA